jgi:hypothetical protein
LEQRHGPSAPKTRAYAAALLNTAPRRCRRALVQRKPEHALGVRIVDFVDH